MNFNDKKTRRIISIVVLVVVCRDGGNDDYPLYDGLE